MPTKERDAMLAELEKKLGVEFNNKKIFDQALTHSSYIHQNKNLQHYERLEFFGDAVLKLVISEYLFKNFPNLDEGELTKIRAVIVSDALLAKKGLGLDLGKYLLLGPNEKRTGGKKRNSNMANSLEAIIGAIYLDSGLDKARQLILNLFNSDIARVSEQDEIYDYKSTLQELVQQQHLDLPKYSVVKERGAEHQKIFTIHAHIDRQGTIVEGRGDGKTKKEAEQKAAEEILKKIKTPV